MPSDAATARAVVEIVAGQHHDAQAVLPQRLQRGLRPTVLPDRRSRSSRRRGRRSRHRSRWRRPVRAASAAASNSLVAMFSSSISIALPSATFLPSTVPVAPLPEGEAKSPASARFAPLSSAAFRIACASGCSLPRSTLAASRSNSPLSMSSAAHDRHDLGLAFGERAGLVDHDGVDALEPLQRLGVADQDSGMRAAADADHDRHRGGKPQRAGTGDDQHRDGGDQAEREARLRPERHPGRERQRPQPRSPQARTSRRPGRQAAGSARASAGRGPPCRRSAPAWCRGRLFRPEAPARRSG